MPVFRFATVQGQNIVWFLRRNCSVTPAQLGWFYASLCVVSLGIAVLFWLQGATLILPFAWLELGAIGVAFLLYARPEMREQGSIADDDDACSWPPIGNFQK